MNPIRLTETPVRQAAVLTAPPAHQDGNACYDTQMETESLLDSEYSAPSAAVTATPQAMSVVTPQAAVVATTQAATVPACPTPQVVPPVVVAPTPPVPTPPAPVLPVPPVLPPTAPEEGEVDHDGMSTISSEDDLMSNINLNDLTHLVDVQAGRSQEILNDQLASRPMRLKDLDDTINRSLQALNVS